MKKSKTQSSPILVHSEEILFQKQQILILKAGREPSYFIWSVLKLLSYQIFLNIGKNWHFRFFLRSVLRHFPNEVRNYIPEKAYWIATSSIVDRVM